jgi:hypothetical protein
LGWGFVLLDDNADKPIYYLQIDEHLKSMSLGWFLGGERPGCADYMMSSSLMSHGGDVGKGIREWVKKVQVR